MPANVAKSASDNAVLNSAIVPVIVFVDKEKDVYFSLDLFTSVINAIRYGITLDTEKFE